MTKMVRRSAAAIAFCLATLAAGTTQASDYGELPNYPLAFDWTGFYLGAHAGAAVSSTVHSTDDDDLEFDLDDHSALGGGLIGFNLQYGYFVYGLEADFSVGEISNHDSVGPGDLFLDDTDVDFDVRPVATFRARAGVAMDTWLFYGTLGLALADTTLEFDTNLPLNSDTNLHLGFVVGAGIEYAVTNWMTLRTEYLWSRYNEENFRIVTDPALPKSSFASDFEVHTLRAGITFNFSRLF